MRLVPIVEGPGLRLDIVYATPANITGRPLYSRPACYLHPDAAPALLKAAELASAIGLSLVVFDAFRPSEAQWALWSHLPDPAYVADPRQGSNHSRGVAVDLCLADGEGRLLDMGTPFDAMEEASHHGSLLVPPEAQRNRFLLLGLMAASGFVHYSFEWWHYELPDAGRYPVLDDVAAGTNMTVP